MVAAKGQDFISAALQEVGGGGGHCPDHAEQCAAIDQFCNAVHVQEGGGPREKWGEPPGEKRVSLLLCSRPEN